MRYQVGFGIFEGDVGPQYWKAETVDRIHDMRAKAMWMRLVIIIFGTLGRVGLLALNTEFQELNAGYFASQTPLWVAGIIGNIAFSAVLLGVVQVTIIYTSEMYALACREREVRLGKWGVLTPRQRQAAEQAEREWILSRVHRLALLSGKD